LEEEQQTQLNSIVTSAELIAEWLNQDNVCAPRNFKQLSRIIWSGVKIMQHQIDTQTYRN